jgi:hypothetical protein
MPLLKTTRLAPNDSKISSGVTLHRRLRDENTLQHSVHLGDLVAVEAHDHDPASWPVPLTTFPYSSGWRLAQVVAFDNDNICVRWFRSLSKTDVVWQHLVGPKQPWRAAVLQVTELDPHLVFEDVMTAAIPVAHVLPCVITILPSSARGQSPEPYFSNEDEDVPAWHIFCKCTHRLVKSDDNWTLERCRDWDSYSDAVATGTAVPPPLLRAWQSSLADLQFAFQNRPMTTPRLQINRLEVDPATVQPCSAPVYQCSEAKDKKDLEFFTGLEWPWDGSHWANRPNGTPSSRRSVLTVGQVVALRAPPFALNHNPTHPFVVPWSAAQVLALYRKDTYFLQVRWLCPWAAMPAEARLAAGWSRADAWTRQQNADERHFLEVNHVAHDIPLSHVLGRVVTDGSAADDEVPIVVRYALDNNQVRPVSGWSSLTTKQLPAPLGRGLLAPDSFTAQHATLRAAYETYSRQILGVRSTAVTLQQGQWTDVVVPNDEEEDTITSHSTWPRDLLLPAPLVPSASPDYILWRAPATGPRFFHRLNVVTRPQRCHSRVTGKKGSPPVSWTVQLGDVVCLAVALGTPPQTDERQPWFPFVGPWRLAQILAIYQSDNDDLRLEVRWLYRQSDLPRRVHGWMPATNDLEVFETDDVVNDVPADWILGRVQLTFLPAAAPMQTDGVPLVRARCRFYYAQERFQPLSAWQQNIQRGCQLSRHAARHPELAAAMAQRFSWSEPMTSTVPATAPVLFTRSVQGQNVDFFVTTWVPFRSDRYLATTLRGGLDHEWPRFWQLAAGDVVASKLESTTDSAPGEVYRPFFQPWTACQILSLYRSIEGSLGIEVRALRTHFDDMDSGLPHVYETKEAVVQTLAQEDLYGPLTLLLGSDPQKFDHVWRQGSDPKPPIAPCLYQGMFCLEMNAPIARSERMIDGLLKRGIAYSNEYQPSEVPLVVQSVRRQVRVFNSPEYDTGEESVVEDFEEESEGMQTEAEDRCSLTTPPFHIDRSSGSKYYSSLSVCPPYDDYATVVPSDVLESPPVWTVKLGDMVIVRSSDSFAGPAAYLGSTLKKSRYFPMTECWGIAEVVTIRECCSEKNDSSETSVEIRWFYRHAELPVSLRKSVHPAKSPFACEEVYESDHYDEVEPESLLAPAVLYAQSSRVQENHTVIGMPFLEFVCHQAFSLSRNSWVPSGDLSGRIGRSRANSGLIRKDPALKLALAQLGEAGLSANREKAIPQSRKDAFRSVLTKLSITDASKEASVKSTALVGREKERGEVLKFLKDAVAGVARDNKSAMFIAGPPVRSSRETMFKLWPDLTIAFILLGSWENGLCKGNDQ